MSAFSDLVDLIRARRQHYARALDGELAKLRIEHGARIVEEARREAELLDLENVSGFSRL
jgi:hypothetical protein